MNDPIARELAYRVTLGDKPVADLSDGAGRGRGGDGMGRSGCGGV